MIFSQNTFNLGLEKNKIKDEKYTYAKEKIFECLKNKSFGFVEELYKQNFKEISKLAQRLKKFDNVLFLGTGGSSLGGKTLVSLIINHLYNKTKPKVFFLENVDPSSIMGLLKNINLKKTACVVTSKSGETIETISQFFFISNCYKKKKISIKNKIFVITEDKKSTLKSIQEEEKLLFSPHPNSIGGRYSVFSIVGLLPAKVVNFNIKSFCDGAKYFLKDLASSKNFDYYFLPIFNLIKLNEKGINMSIMMPYYDSLNSLSLWYRQLWAESIGKNGKGITPINSLGTVDQHSQLQLYLDGPRDKFFTIIGKKKEEKNMKMDCRYAKSKIFDSLHNKSLETLLNAEMNATIQTMKNKKLPMRVLTLDSLSENFMGSLMMFFFLETIFSCFLLDLNPFDQPAVEEGKKLTKIFLKKDE